MNASVDRDICIGCGLCCETCGAVFHMNETGTAEACQAVTRETQSDVQAAIDACPVSAIRWQE